MILRVVGKPRPLPPARVEKNASKIRARTSSVIPTPVSITSSRTHGPCRRVVRISSPPWGIACSAFKTRFKTRLLEQLAIEQAQRQVARERGADHDSLGRRVRLVEISHLVDDRVQIGRLELQLLHPGKPQEALEDAVQPLDLGPKPLEPLQHPPVTRRLRVLKILEQQIEVQRQRRERIADLVRQAPRKLRDLRVLSPQPLGRVLLRVERSCAGRLPPAVRPPASARGSFASIVSAAVLARRAACSAGLLPGFAKPCWSTDWP